MTTTAERTYTEEFVEAGGIRIQLRKGGEGEPLLVLHSELGVPGWIEAYERLAQRYSVYVPSLPGFGESKHAESIADVRDLAAWVTWCARDLELPQPMHVVGFSMGGWVAAEIATVNSSIFKKMVLVGAAGLKPEQGETWDYFVNSGRQAFERAFHDQESSPEYARYYGRDWTPEEEEQVEINRETAARLLWKPYLRSKTLAGLLGGIATPTLVVWGREDAIIPLNAGELYERAIPGATSVVLDGCGHIPEMEQPERFAQIVHDFLSGGKAAWSGKSRRASRRSA